MRRFHTTVGSRSPDRNLKKWRLQVTVHCRPCRLLRPVLDRSSGEGGERRIIKSFSSQGISRNSQIPDVQQGGSNDPPCTALVSDTRTKFVASPRARIHQ